jgi:MFS family permease
MALLALSHFLLGAPDVAFLVLLIATGALGLGFGATVMALNTYAETFFPASADRAVLVLNALLGLGTALAPVLVALVVHLGAWWLLPVVMVGVLTAIFGIALKMPLRISAGVAGSSEARSLGLEDLPHRFWLYAIAVFLYGILETLNGNWAVLYLSAERGASARTASFALTAFWVMVTVGRVLIAVISRRVPARWIYVALAIMLVAIFQMVSRVQSPNEGILAFGFAGLACSAFLPLSISFGGTEFPRLSAVLAGELIAFYQLGYGVAAFGIGPLRDWIGLPFHTIFAAASIIAGLLAVFAFLAVRLRPPLGSS